MTTQPQPSLAERVHALKVCLAEDERDHDLTVPALVRTFAFNLARVEAHRQTIADLLNRMPSQFHRSVGGGWSFLNLCVDRDGNLWGEHAVCEFLVVLGIAAGMAWFQLPRYMWCHLPGGVPYVCFDTTSTRSEGQG